MQRAYVIFCLFSIALVWLTTATGLCAVLQREDMAVITGGEDDCECVRHTAYEAWCGTDLGCEGDADCVYGQSGTCPGSGEYAEKAWYVGAVSKYGGFVGVPATCGKMYSCMCEFSYGSYSWQCYMGTSNQGQQGHAYTRAYYAGQCQ